MSASAPRVLVLGAGSIGSRHARNLAAAGARVSVMDPDPGRSRAVPDATPLPYDLADVGGFDGIVVASPSSCHHEHLAFALAHSPFVLVEKPIAVRADLVESLVADHGDRVMVGYNLRLHRPVERLLELVDRGVAGEIHRVAVWFGSYLPDWRPAVDYRTSYSARAELGGGVLLDAIHELDLVHRVLGPGCRVESATVERIGDLEIDVEDFVHAVIRPFDRQAVATVELDYLSRDYRRGIEVAGSRGTVRLDWARGTLEWPHEGDVRVETLSTPLAASYEREAAVFLAWMAGETVPPCRGEEGLASLVLADAIRARALVAP